MEIQEISAPVWANAEKTAIDCMVKFTELEFSVPYTATADDSDNNGRFIGRVRQGGVNSVTAFRSGNVPVMR